MEKKDALLQILQEAPDHVSGSELAGRLGVTRMSVWKYIQFLRAEGYAIEAVTNRGYRLSPDNDVITADGVQKALDSLAGQFSLEVLPVCDSTNQVLIDHAPGLPEWHVIIAGRQTAGRGRKGRNFFSPDGTGLYLSVLLRPWLPAADASLITVAAAVAVCRAIDELAGVRTQIKWVNDIFLEQKKVCGILTEASFDVETGTIGQAVLGVGINVTEPDAGFPPELSDIAGAVFAHRQKDMRNRMAAAFLRHFFWIYTQQDHAGFIEEYRSRSFLVGRQICVLHPDAPKPARVLDVDERCRLLVQYPDGSQEALSSGEVSVRLTPENSKKPADGAGNNGMPEDDTGKRQMPEDDAT